MNCQKCQFSLPETASQVALKCPRCNTWNEVQGACRSTGSCSSCHTAASSCASGSDSKKSVPPIGSGLWQKLVRIFKPQ